MKFRVESTDPGTTDTAAADLAALARGWGHEPTQIASPPLATGDDKVIDPVAVAALLVSIPSAALAVADLTDRIRTRRRAQDLVDQARQHATDQVTTYLLIDDRAVDVAALTADQVLDLLADDPPT